MTSDLLNDSLNDCLQATEFFDFNNPQVSAYGDKLLEGVNLNDKIAVAKALYLGVRDDIRYNPYVFQIIPKTLSASYCLEDGQSYCIPKAVLLGALARKYGIPSRLGLADVKNHLSSQQLIDFLRSDIFVMHGFIELYLPDPQGEMHWVKATPAFNERLCRLMKVDVLEFDGYNDSIFQEFDENGGQHMEYLADHGTFADVPMDFIVESVDKAYPHLVKALQEKQMKGRSLEAEV